MANNSYTNDELRMLPTKVLVGLKRITEKDLLATNSRLGSAQSQYNKAAGIRTSRDGKNGGVVVNPARDSGGIPDTKLRSATQAMAGTSAILKELAGQGSNPFTNMEVDQGVLEGVLAKLDDDARTHAPVNSEVKDEVKQARISRLHQKVANLKPKVDEARALIHSINNILKRRARLEEEGPRINTEALPEVGITSKSATEFLNKTIVAPTIASDTSLLDTLSQIIETQHPDLAEHKIDLIYGPPISVKGQFVLSRDGLYYGSRDVTAVPSIKGDPFASSALTSGKGAANLGGRGIHYDESNLDSLKGTQFDINMLPIDNQQYESLLKMDSVLRSLEDEKQKQIYDTSTEISQLLGAGQDTSGALVQNHYMTLNSYISSYDIKIKKRKKQLELALFSGKYKVKNGTLLHVDRGEENNVTHVPVNDFSFLRGVGVSYNIEDQISLTLARGDVSDVVLPIIPKYLQTYPKDVFVFDRFSIPKQGKGGYPQREAAGTSVSGTEPWIRNLTDSVITDGLEVGFAFLDPSVVTASSTVANVDNFAVDGEALDATLVGTNGLSVFPSGLSIPKLTGTQATAGQSYCQVPTHSTINDMFYSKKGFSMSWWQYMPPLTGTAKMFSTTHKYRLIFANENCGDGGQTSNTDEITAITNPPDKKVKGLVVGWREGTTTDVPKFIFKVTCSQNEKYSQWLPSVCFSEDKGRNQEGIELDQTTDFARDLSGGFHHMSISFDVARDTYSLYYDSTLMQTSGIEQTFGNKLLRTPTFMTPADRSLALSSFQPLTDAGPLVFDDSLFTPYIIGGGYTDGMTTNGFMGSNKNSYYHSQSTTQDTTGAGVAAAQSGFDGYIGLFTMYSKPLNSKEVKRNYTLSKDFFTNIEI